MNLNKAILAGRVCQTPEIKALPSGVTVASFSLAINKYWTDKQGQKQEEVEFLNIVFFGKSAETIGRYVVKGQVLLVEGRIQTRSWDDKEGNKKYRTEIIGETFQFGQAPSDADTKRTGYQKSQGIPAEKRPEDGQHDPEKYEGMESHNDDINPEDIPF